MKKVTQKFNDSREAWAQQTTAFGVRTKKASTAFATDTKKAVTKLGEFARGDIKDWAALVVPDAIELKVPVQIPAEAFTPREVERALLQQLIAALEGLVSRAKTRLADLETDALLPLDSYEELTARAIVGQLDELDMAAVRAVRDFEAKNKGRATVLKACDQRLAN